MKMNISVSCFLTLITLFNVADISVAELPKVISTICKRNQKTISDCVKRSIEQLIPHLVNGIPELNVPGIDPFVIKEIQVDTGIASDLKALGKNVKVYGASNLTITNLEVDLDAWTINGRVQFPRLHLVGKYQVDGQILILPLHGHGDITTDVLRSDAVISGKARLVDRDGQQYLKFTSIDVDLTVKDYTIRLDNLFNGNAALGEAANQAINQNKKEFIHISKPAIETTIGKLFLKTANNIASTAPITEILPYE